LSFSVVLLLFFSEIIKKLLSTKIEIRKKNFNLHIKNSHAHSSTPSLNKYFQKINKQLFTNSKQRLKHLKKQQIKIFLNYFLN